MRKLTVAEIPEGWTPNADVYLVGNDKDAQYYRLGDNVYRHSNGGTRFFSTIEAWPLGMKAYQISEATA